MKLVTAVILAALVVGVPSAEASLAPYADESSLLATAPGTDDGSVAATMNPAQWGLLERPETAIWWSDRQVLGDRRDDYGFSMGRGLGLSYRHRILPTLGGPRGVGDWQIGLGWKDAFGATGIAYGFSGPGRSAFDRTNFLSLGRVARPTPWLSLGWTGRTNFQGADDGQADLGLRPLSDPRLTLFVDYSVDEHTHWNDGDASFGAAIRPVPGLEAAGRWSEHDRFQLTLGVTVSRNGFRSHSRYDHSDLGGTNFVARFNPPVRGIDPATRLLRGRRWLEMDLKGDAVYQSNRFFDSGTIPLRRVLDDLALAAEDPTVGGVTLNLSGFSANIEMVWEIREKLLALRRAGKKSVVYIDNASTGAYYLATAADRLVMDPQGTLLLPGVQMSRTYMKDTLAKLGIGFEELRYFKYKSAMEAFSRRDMSEADREQRGDLVKATYEELANGVVATGRMNRAQYDSIVNEMPYLSARRLLERHGVDELGGPETLRETAKKVAGRRVLFQKPGAARDAHWTPEETWGPPPTIVLVYAVGDCAMDSGIRGRATSKALKRFRESRRVNAVVVRADSPGGDPLASDLLAREMLEYRKTRKPLLVSQGRVAASGGYWISMDAARITASPFTITGSIGVIGGWAWNEGLGKKIGMTSDHVQEGKSADLLGGLRLPILGVTIPERNLDEREHVVVKQGILDVYDDFTRRVAEGRGLTVERVREIGEGHVYSGRAALDLKLVDQIATMDETIEMAKAAAGIRKGRRVRIVEYPKPRLFVLPRFLPAIRAVPAGGALDSESPWTYEQRALGSILLMPGAPLLLTPPSLLPDEAAAR